VKTTMVCAGGGAKSGCNVSLVINERENKVLRKKYQLILFLLRQVICMLPK